jgi:acyl-coenzyme A synthetase/AMP-(fatty) acid ligase
MLAFFPLDGTPCTFGELSHMASKARFGLKRRGIGQGDSLVLADSVSAEFYAVVMAALSMGVVIVLVEPFLPLSEIESIVQKLRPKILVASIMGRLWGARSTSIRSIPFWMSAKSLCHESGLEKLIAESLPLDHPGIITFTSGTTSKSKGVIRTHAGLTAQNIAIKNAADFDQFKGPDLAIFANLVLANLGMGRGTIYVSPKWRIKELQRIQDLPFQNQPDTLSSGPAFLEQLLNLEKLPKLKSIHIGGALTDCSTFEKSFERFPQARIIHVYGSSEAEPVAFSDARAAVKLSRERGLMQTLHIGNFIPEIKGQLTSEGLWVTGEHVCRYYFDNPLENQKTKRPDAQGNVWHFMGDRIANDAQGLWYQGRAFQTPESFQLEQEIYSMIGHTNAFLFRDSFGKQVLSGENLDRHRVELLKRYPEIERIQQKKIKRDRRHRARINRESSQ